jgi:CRP/FNR family cyclic AMP-dependent transcriptional regulator
MTTALKHSVEAYPAGSVIFRDGDARLFLYIVQKGQIAIFKTTPQNERIPLGIVGSGEYLAEIGILDNKASHGTWALALTDVEIIKIPNDAFNEQLKNAPPWLVAMAKGLSQKLRRMNDLVRRNRLADDSLDSAILAVQVSEEKRKGGA